MNPPGAWFLLDANVMLALAWPQHTHHSVAHAWFQRKGAKAWATCASTQLAFVRISANPRLTVEGASPRAAAELLAQMVQLPGHRYLSELPARATMANFGSKQLLGHRQVTDLYLLSLVQHHGGRLATFDTGIPQLLPSDADRRAWVELIAG